MFEAFSWEVKWVFLIHRRTLGEWIQEGWIRRHKNVCSLHNIIIEKTICFL